MNFQSSCRLLFLVLTIVYGIDSFSQKKILDLNSIKEWSGTVADGGISNDGKYVFYKNSNKFTIQSADNIWKKEFTNVGEAFFTADNKNIVFIKSYDTLCILKLGKPTLDTVFTVASFKLISSTRSELLICKLKSADQKLVIKNLSNGKVKSWQFVSDYWLSKNGEVVIIQRTIKRDTSFIYSLDWHNIENEDNSRIWSGSKVTQLYFDKCNAGIAFTAEEKVNNKPHNSIWYYNHGRSSSFLLMDENSLAKGSDLIVGGIHSLGFSQDSKKLFIYLEGKEIQKNVSDQVQVDVWSYIDYSLQSVQLSQSEFKTELDMIDLSTKKIVRLTNGDDVIVGCINNNVLLKRDLGNYGSTESFWNCKAQPFYSIVSIVDGNRKSLSAGISDDYGGIMISPDRNWILYYDHVEKGFFSYEVSTGVVRNLTKNISFIWRDEYNDHPQLSLRYGAAMCVWLKDSRRFFIYDSYDIWLFDPFNKMKPLNVTNGFGKKHCIKFELVDEGQYFQDISIEDSVTIFLQAFNTISKEQGFYSKKLGKPGNPRLCSMGSFVYGFWSGYDDMKSYPLKAKDSIVYLVTRMSANDAPNFFITRDYKTFQRITDVQPQKNYNWYISELHEWQSLDGVNLKGVLYKPENFDPNKKYPVIFDYYEKRSDELNMFRWPEPSKGRINIPLFVSAGYLVFTPDINYKMGNPGKSAYNSIVSAATYLSKFTWVDSKHLGIQGHSFGGYETNYIITHTKIFAAACSASGICDLISFYSSGLRGGYNIYWSERWQGRLGGTPWEMPSLYFKNSPIYKADKIVTPLLMMNNKKDRNVPFSQGVEFFTSLRRLGKKVWMLQYDDQYHTVESGSAAEDYHIRMMQFFDHYLKDKPAPVWMTRGIPANMKGIEDGLEYDMEIKTPGPGLNAEKKFKKSK